MIIVARKYNPDLITCVCPYRPFHVPDGVDRKYSPGLGKKKASLKTTGGPDVVCDLHT